MSKLYGLTFQLDEPTPNKPTKVISIMVDEKGEKYINYLHQQLEQKENIIKEVREKLKELVEDDGTFIGEIDYLRKKELLEILDKVD